jgi:adenylosuccinate lyase
LPQVWLSFRKVDLRVANALSAFGATVQKITGDIRHLAAQKEIEEPFEVSGSSVPQALNCFILTVRLNLSLASTFNSR